MNLWIVRYRVEGVPGWIIYGDAVEFDDALEDLVFVRNHVEGATDAELAPAVAGD